MVQLRRLPVLAASLLVMASGCGGESGSSEQSEASRPVITLMSGARGEPSPVVRGGSPRQRALLTSILAGIRGAEIQDTRIRPPGKGWRESKRLGARGRTWLTIAIESGQLGSQHITSTWTAALVAGTFRDGAHAARLSDVLGYTPIVRFENGLRSANGQLLGGSFTHKTDARDQDALLPSIERELRAASQKAGGFEDVALSFHRPKNLAVIVDIRTRAPRRAAEFFYGNRPFADLEGALIIIRSSSGEPFFAQAAARRANYGAVWVRE